MTPPPRAGFTYTEEQKTNWDADRRLREGVREEEIKRGSQLAPREAEALAIRLAKAEREKEENAKVDALMTEAASEVTNFVGAIKRLYSDQDLDVELRQLAHEPKPGTGFVMTKLVADDKRVTEAQEMLEVTRAARTAFDEAAVFRRYARANLFAELRKWEEGHKLEGHTWSFTGFVEKSKAKAEAEAATTQAKDAHTVFVDKINDLKKILVEFSSLKKILGETELDKLLGPAQLDENRAAEKFAELEARLSDEKEKINAVLTTREAVIKVLMKLKHVDLAPRSSLQRSCSARRLESYVLGWKGNADLMTLVTSGWRSQLPPMPRSRSRVPRAPRPPAKQKDLGDIVKPDAIAKLNSGLQEADGTAFTADAIKELLGEEIVKELTDKEALKLRRPAEQLSDTQKRTEILTQLGLTSKVASAVLEKLELTS